MKSYLRSAYWVRFTGSHSSSSQTWWTNKHGCSGGISRLKRVRILPWWKIRGSSWAGNRSSLRRMLHFWSIHSASCGAPQWMCQHSGLWMRPRCRSQLRWPNLNFTKFILVRLFVNIHRVTAKQNWLFKACWVLRILKISIRRGSLLVSNNNKGGPVLSPKSSRLLASKSLILPTMRSRA